MFEPWFHEIARQRQQDRLASAERFRLGRIVRGRTADRETAASKRAFAVRIRRTSKLAARSEGVKHGSDGPQSHERHLIETRG